MHVQPAKLDQVKRGRDGRMHVIDADAGGVAEGLRRIDPGFQVRFAEAGNPPYFVVFYQHCAAHRDHDVSCADCREGRATDLVLTQQAYQNAFGVWEGLHEGVVHRVQMIDPRGRGGYDYAREVERQNREADVSRRRNVRERIEEHGDKLAHALRRDLHLDKARVFVPDRSA